MSQRTRVILGVLALVIVVGAMWWSKASTATPAGRLVVAGDVRSDIRTVTAPIIVYPVPDYTVGMPATSTASSTSATKRSSGASSSSRSPVVSGMLKRVYVHEGDTVKAGDILATYDTKMLDLGVVAAKADARRTKTNVSLMNKALDSIQSAKGKLATARSTAFGQVAKGIATAKAKLYKQHADAVKALPSLEAQMGKLQAELAVTPPTDANFAVIKAQIKQLMPLLMGAEALVKGWPQIKKAFAKQTGKAAKKAAATINSKIGLARSKIRKAEKQIKDARSVLRIIANSAHVGIDLAEAKRDLAVVRAPVGGVVTFARAGGTVAMVGAPLVRIIPDTPQKIDTYLTPEQIATVAVGDAVDVSFDSSGHKVVHGTVSSIGTEYLFPPTSFPTQVVHMTKTLKTTITLDQGYSAPPGTPVDLSIHLAKN
jgi:multidrug resistance efflux pump